MQVVLARLRAHRPYFFDYAFLCLWFVVIGLGCIRYAGRGNSIDCVPNRAECIIQHRPAWGATTSIIVTFDEIQAVTLKKGSTVPYLPSFSRVEVQTARGTVPLTEQMQPQPQVPAQVALQAYLKGRDRVFHWEWEALHTLRRVGWVSLAIGSLIAVLWLGLTLWRWRTHP